jgi:hypothetical protein
MPETKDKNEPVVSTTSEETTERLQEAADTGNPATKTLPITTDQNIELPSLPQLEIDGLNEKLVPSNELSVKELIQDLSKNFSKYKPNDLKANLPNMSLGNRFVVNEFIFSNGYLNKQQQERLHIQASTIDLLARTIKKHDNGIEFLSIESDKYHRANNDPKYVEEVSRLGSNIATLIRSPAQLDAFVKLVDGAKCPLYEMHLSLFAQHASHYDHPLYASAAKAWIYEPCIELELASELGEKIKYPWQALAMKPAIEHVFENDFGRKGSYIDFYESLRNDATMRDKVIAAYDAMIGKGAEHVLTTSKGSTIVDIIDYRHPKLDKSTKDLLAYALQSLGENDKTKVFDIVRSVPTSTFSDINRVDSIEEPLQALKLSLTFGKGRTWETWLKLQGELGRSVHDATFWLPERPHDPSLSAWLIKYAKADIANSKNPDYEPKPIEELRQIAERWDRLSTADREGTYNQILDRTNSLHFDVIKDQKFADEAYKAKAREDHYASQEFLYMNSIDLETVFPKDKIWTSQDGNYIGRFLPQDDPRRLFLGHYTGCCQYIDGDGDYAARYGQQNPNADFFVVEDKAGSIKAFSLTWQNEQGEICFDNIEIAKDDSTKPPKDIDHKAAVEVYQNAANDLVENAPKVTVGLRYTKLSMPDSWTKADGEQMAKLPSNYTGVDTDSVAQGQVILASNSNFEKTDKSTSNIWVHAGDAKDLSAIEQISMLSGKRENIVGSDIKFIVLNTREHGVIGYAALNTKNNNVNSIDMHPNFKDPVNSQKLIDALAQYMERSGHEWSAQVSEETKNALISRGLIQIKSAEPVAKNNKESMYKIAFRPSTDEEKQAFREKGIDILVQEIVSKIPAQELHLNSHDGSIINAIDKLIEAKRLQLDWEPNDRIIKEQIADLAMIKKQYTSNKDYASQLHDRLNRNQSNVATTNNIEITFFDPAFSGIDTEAVKADGIEITRSNASSSSITSHVKHSQGEWREERESSKANKKSHSSGKAILGLMLLSSAIKLWSNRHEQSISSMKYEISP